MEGIQFISCLRFSMQLLLLESFFTLAWKKKDHFIIRVALSILGYLLLAYIVFSAFVAIPGYHPVIYTVYYCSLFALSLFVMRACFKMPSIDILFAGVCGYASQHIAYAIHTIFQEVTGIKLDTIPDFIFLRFLPYLLVGIVIYLFLIKPIEGKGEMKEKDLRMVILASLILVMVVFISVLVDSRYFQNESEILRNVICKLYAIVCCILAILVAFNISKQNQIIREKSMMESMLHNLKEQQRLSKENINIINIKCHDLKYRISKISKIEDSLEQHEYIEHIKEAIAIYDNIYQVGNDTLDLVLTEKSLLCKEYQIKLSCMIDGTALEFMNSNDLYALFGNLLDNAIESVIQEKNEEKRIISISVKKRSKGSHIHIDNYCNRELVFSEGFPITTKEDKNQHGFGVKSIKYIVEKYNGDVLMQVENQRFQVDIMFYITNFT